MARIQNLAKTHWERFTSSDNLGDDILFTSPGGSPVIVTIKGTTNIVAISFTTDGQDVISGKGNITFAESLLTAQSYPVRNAEGDVSLATHRVSFNDANGDQQEFRIINSYPDQRVGMIICILEQFQT